MFVFVYPATKSVYVFKSSEVVRLNVEDTLDFDPVLPGFSLPVREIF